MSDLRDIGLNVTGNNFEREVKLQKIKNTSGTGLVGYQITVKIGIIDPDEPYTVKRSEYIINPDGSRKFITNQICKNNVCLTS